MRFSCFRLFFLFCALLAVSGCGKKGALYLPDTVVAVPTASQFSQPAQK